MVKFVNLGKHTIEIAEVELVPGMPVCWDLSKGGSASLDCIWSVPTS